MYAFHGNDSWKITPKLTFNYGLRWDYYSPSREKYNHLSFFDPTGINPTAGIPGRLAFAGEGGQGMARSDLQQYAIRRDC